MDDVAQHMLLEIMRRLTIDGYTVYLIDQDDTLPDVEALRKMQVAVLESVDEIGLV